MKLDWPTVGSCFYNRQNLVITETLVFYDEPQLFISNYINKTALFLAADDLEGDSLYLINIVNIETLRKLKNNEITVRDAMIGNNYLVQGSIGKSTCYWKIDSSKLTYDMLPDKGVYLKLQPL
jgi:hypothetical protein